MKSATQLLIGVWLVLSATLCSEAMAAPAGQTFNAPDENGKIERVDVGKRELVVDDARLRLADGVVVYTHRGFPTSPDALHKGMRIAFDIRQDEGGTSYVSVIWILSKR